MTPHSQVLRILKDTSRTFYLPVVRLPGELQETVASAYLCMRAIDEVEDHPNLDRDRKVLLLHEISHVMQTATTISDGSLNELNTVFHHYNGDLPEVTMRLREWACHAPDSIAPRIWDTTAAMADRMAHWVARNWEIRTRADLDGYTFSVAGTVGLLICDIWAWFDGTQIDRTCALRFGRGLQAVNIIRNRNDDLKRNVDFYPQGWTRDQMFAYAYEQLNLAKLGARTMPNMAFKYLVEIPLLLAEATLKVLERGEEKLSRSAVIQIVRQVGLEENAITA